MLKDGFSAPVSQAGLVDAPTTNHAFHQRENALNKTDPIRWDLKKSWLSENQNM